MTPAHRRSNTDNDVLKTKSSKLHVLLIAEATNSGLAQSCRVSKPQRRSQRIKLAQSLAHTSYPAKTETNQDPLRSGVGKHLHSSLHPSTSSKAEERQGSKRSLEQPDESFSPVKRQKREPCSTSSIRSYSKEASIHHWRTQGQWPKRLFSPPPMAYLLARKNSSSSLGRKRSKDGSVIASTISNEQTRDEKSSPYQDARYEDQLSRKGFYLTSAHIGFDKGMLIEIGSLFKQETSVPEGTLFGEEVFMETCERISSRNETRIMCTIRNLIVPSAEELMTLKRISNFDLIESMNEGWTCTIPITPVRPQPDYAVGFCRGAFSSEQLLKLQPILGSNTMQSYFRATWYMYFPFLTCEVKQGNIGLVVADRQNAHSAGIGTRAVLELYKLLGREAEVDRQVLAFSVSHSEASVRIYGHYPVTNQEGTTYHRYKVEAFDIDARNGKDRWTTYKFIKNLYEHWAPKHLKRIHAIIDALPDDISTVLGTPYGDSSSFAASAAADTGSQTQSEAETITQGNDSLETSLPTTLETVAQVKSLSKRPVKKQR